MVANTEANQVRFNARMHKKLNSNDILRNMVMEEETSMVEMIAVFICLVPASEMKALSPNS